MRVSPPETFKNRDVFEETIGIYLRRVSGGDTRVAADRLARLPKNGSSNVYNGETFTAGYLNVRTDPFYPQCHRDLPGV
jgi:hypothetical protein